MMRLVWGLLVAIVVGVAASRGIVWLGFDAGRAVPVALALGAVAAWPLVGRWWGGTLAGWAARWLVAAAVVVAVIHWWGCPAPG